MPHIVQVSAHGSRTRALHDVRSDALAALIELNRILDEEVPVSQWDDNPWTRTVQPKPEYL